MDSSLQTFSLKRSKRIFKRTIICILLTALILTGSAPSFAADKGEDIKPSAKVSAKGGPDITATSAILIDAGSGMVLYEKDAYKQTEPASITKMLTALIAIESLDLDQKLTCTVDFDPEGTNINMKKGESLTVEQLLYATLLESANEAADTLAIAVGGSVEKFSDIMDARAAECGAGNTDFSCASGLTKPGGSPHLTTAYDISKIAVEAMKNPVFRKIVGTATYTIPATNMSGERKLKNTNVFLHKTNKTVEINGKERLLQYKGVNGIKTGFIEAAGYCFCGSARRGDTELIGVILNGKSGKDRFADIMALWDYGFSKYYTYNAARADEPLEKFKVWQGERGSVQVGVAEDMDITLNKGYDSSEIELDTVKNDMVIKAPVKKGQSLGQLEAYDKDGALIASSQLIAMNDVEKGGVLSYIGIADEDIGLFIGALVTTLLLLTAIRIIIVRNRRKRRKRRRARRSRDTRRRRWDRERSPFDR